ncbi:MAG: hypothetical protein COV98_00500 [Candidatus Altarchaeum sp. CG12_big_fil_rev_8_21_14_0_65_33_22]|uniref:Intein C-terminal splicing domain-containing protein n=1 Tax=Candidatus Altarchaeum hamiconexum TaxID=1803513 RepID=A0A8J7YU11_9ARCH|nr:hypothetical protein [Candidatus Altarchaeum hamiconexum]OIQ06012.1 MAG: hypothetical protein AUK59_01530 [Candidatus Altarchaeum sp. CG2_30_32_3053]PIN68098.1 MAG: hypothetical protein COV98_00500 [Candidatus Altarchaeum sp. CG12_big_fil_rev_8_21_14_0_65_33_22]PIV28873.1 MAG: hypothetical protein COS36_00760 [Candidatus Altarchaeum sp. CG03_land_8_20_14_0_80_32_618]PIZ32487.1 MAG: hypothetical protein COY41_01035 [Candidatus Altarchaeum sp. CG_4_10_14_0_8_um_filter_32_851]PJC15440.1 MAG: h
MEELLAPGTRTCAGCGAAIAIRMVLRAIQKEVGKNFIICHATGCMEVATTPYPETSWKIPWIHVAFENVSAVASGVNAAYEYINEHINENINENNKTDKPKIIAIGGDGSTFDIGFGSLSGMLERNDDVLYICYDNEAYMNCLTADALIITEKGLRKITEIKKGDKIYSFDQNTHKMLLKECLGVYDNGEKQVFSVETLHHTLKATGNHPFLVVQHNGKGKESTLIWKNVEHLKAGNDVVVLKKFNEGKSFEFSKIDSNEYFGDEKIREIKYLGVEPTYDLQVDESHNFIANGYVVHNTGIQQSGATPKFASTSTTPVGKAIPGNLQRKKNMVEISAAHNVYAASTTIYNFKDLENKVRKALRIKGAKYIQIFASCPTGWRMPEKDAIKITKLAIETGVYKVFEIENRKFKLNYKPAKRKKVEEYLKVQGRFRHLTPQQTDEIQMEIDKEWQELEKMNASAATI